MKKLLLTFLLFCAPVFAGQYEVVSLPCTLTVAKHSADAWDTVTIAGTKLSSLNHGLHFSSNYWILNLADDTIRFGTDSTYRGGTYFGSRGVSVGSGYHDITINGGYIIDDPDNIEDLDSIYDANDTVSYYHIGVKLSSNNYNVHLIGVHEISVRGAFYSSAVEITAGYNNTIENCRLFNHAYAYRSREAFMATCISVTGDSANVTQPTDYHLKVTNSYLEDWAHAAIYARWNAAGSNDRINLQLIGDTIVVDCRNRRYVGFTGVTGASTTQTYGLAMTGGGRGTVIKNCHFTCGDVFGGGRGIISVYSQGVQDEPIKICSNYISVHEGYNQEYKALYGATAIKVRQMTRWMDLFDNVLIVTVDTNTAICANYNPNGGCFGYQVWDANAQPPFHINFENNICSLKVRTNADAYPWSADAIKFDFVRYEDASSHFRNNYFYSKGTSVIDYGQFDGAAAFITTQENTIELDTTGAPLYPQATFNVGMIEGTGNQCADTNIVSLDEIFVGGASPNSVVHYYHGNPTPSGHQEIHIARTLNLHVKGDNGVGVSQAVCSVWSQYGLVWTGLTNGLGNVSGISPFSYSSRTDPDSFDYNPYIIHVTKDTGFAYDSNFTINEIAAIVADTFTLSFESNPPEGYNPAELKAVFGRFRK